MTVTLPGGPSGPPFSLALWLCNGFLSCSFLALAEQWLCGSVADKMFFSTPLRLYEVSERLLSETTRTTCTTLEIQCRLQLPITCILLRTQMINTI